MNEANKNTNIRTILGETTYISIALTFSIAIGAYYVGTLANSIEANARQISELEKTVQKNQMYYQEINARLSRIEGILERVEKK